ncbi:MAG TPA: MBL fold metallo-hydrolase [Candidatus Saccharimonadales bacterium]|nr:MBL fold metallo-hydrolase [Candidatus Saccharimonadales bacterium]
MEITFLGMNCVRLTGKDVAILCDPFPKSAGLPEFKQASDATLLTVPGSELPAKPGMVIDSPGEYEIKGTTITGTPARLHTDSEESPATAAVYLVLVDGVRVAYLGNIAPKLTNEQIELLGQADVLVLPVGGHGLTLDAVAAAGIISELEPKYVIPTHYDDGATKYAMPQDKLEVFLKEIGTTPEPLPKLRITSKDLPLETTVVALTRQGG